MTSRRWNTERRRCAGQWGNSRAREVRPTLNATSRGNRGEHEWCVCLYVKERERDRGDGRMVGITESGTKCTERKRTTGATKPPPRRETRGSEKYADLCANSWTGSRADSAPRLIVRHRRWVGSVGSETRPTSKATPCLARLRLGWPNRKLCGIGEVLNLFIRSHIRCKNIYL